MLFRGSGIRGRDRNKVGFHPLDSLVGLLHFIEFEFCPSVLFLEVAFHTNSSRVRSSSMILFASKEQSHVKQINTEIKYNKPTG